MADPSAPTEVNNVVKNETHVSVDIPAEKTDAESEKTHPGLGILHRVPLQLRKNKNHIYSPAVLSLGPYHRNLRSKQFVQVEQIKNEIANKTLDPSRRGFFYGEILGRVDEIRIFYEGLTIVEYDDKALAEMMLRDACFLLYYMELGIGDEDDSKERYLAGRLGMSGVVLLCRDFCMLENQIPFWIIKLLITLKFDDKDAGEAFLCKFLSSVNFGDHRRLTRLPWEGEEEEPLHLLEADRKTVIMKEETSHSVERGRRILNMIKWRRRRSIRITNFELIENSLFRSVTNLKAKGIRFGPSSYCVTDIRFDSYALYGKLLLPIWFVTNNTKTFFYNVIALEMSGGTNTNFDFLSYFNFMKSLLETPKDVKELREKGILFSSLRNDGEVLRVFKEIDTYGINNEDIFYDVKMRINEHCDSKTKTWMAELIHTYFHSPWTAVALFAAAFLLCLTFLQTYYTMNPVKNN